MPLGCDCLYDSFYTYTVITVWFMIETKLLKWQSALILYMILFTHAMIIIWFSIEREEKWSHSSSAAFTTSIAGGDDATVSLSISVEQALANHANSSNPTHLSSQNSRLWNHLRKQRHNYSLASNDAKRLRAGHDQLRVKLETLNKGKEVSNDKNLNVPASASSGFERSSDEANRDVSNDLSMKPSESSSSSRAQPAHHHSEGRTSGMHFVPEIHIAR